MLDGHLFVHVNGMTENFYDYNIPKKTFDNMVLLFNIY